MITALHWLEVYRPLGQGLLSEVEPIGRTDATIAQHISTIQERSYAEKDAGQKLSFIRPSWGLRSWRGTIGVCGFGMFFFVYFFFKKISIIVFFNI